MLKIPYLTQYMVFLAKKEEKQMKIGLIGFGSMGKTHLYSVRNIPFFFNTDIKAEVKWICTRNIDKAREAAQKYGVPFYTDNEDDVINDEEVDIIDICTPNNCHFETAKKAILAGKHVYCEKPVGTEEYEAETLDTLAYDNKVYAQVVFNNRFLAPIMRAKELIEEGYLGRILSFNFKYHHSSALDINKNAGWKQNKDICGGGVLFDLGSHVIDLVLYLINSNFKTIFGKEQIAFPKRKGIDGKEWQTNADEAFYILATLENGAHGTIEVSKIVTGSNDDLAFEIHGEDGSLKFNLMDPNFLEVYKSNDNDDTLGAYKGYTRIECVNRYPRPGGVFPSQKAPVGWLRGHIGSYFSFLDSINKDITPEPSLKQASKIHSVMRAAYISSELGKEVIL